VPDRRFPLLHRGSADPAPTPDEPTAPGTGADPGERSVAVLDDEPTGQLPGWTEPTGEYDDDSREDSGDDEHDGPGADEDWLVPDRRRRVRIAVPTLLLCALILVAGAFWGGAVVDKHFGNHATTAATAGGRTAGAFAGFGGGTGAAGGTGTGASGFGGFSRVTPAAEGTLSAINGQTLTVKPTSGSPVTVKLTATTVVTRSGTGTPGALTVGDTVTVDGTAGSGGVSTTTGGFGSAAGGSSAGGSAAGFGSTTGSSTSSGGFGSTSGSSSGGFGG
jgi:hypothetical protein